MKGGRKTLDLFCFLTKKILVSNQASQDMYSNCHKLTKEFEMVLSPDLI